MGAFDNALQERPQEERVAHRDKVDGAAHEREAHRSTVEEQASEIVRVEALQSRPEAVVGRHRRLRLQTQQVLERLGKRSPHAAQQRLALQQRAVERTRSDW